MRAAPALTLGLLIACAGDATGLDSNGDPIGSPDPGGSVTLSVDVQPIFSANCALSGCHAGTNPVLGQNLSAGQAYRSIVNVFSQEAPTLRRVRPLVQGTPASGIFTVEFRDARHGILAGGDLEAPDAPSDNVAVSKDGGKTWKLVSGTPFPGAAFGLSYVPTRRHGQNERMVVITGPGGAA